MKLTAAEKREEKIEAAYLAAYRDTYGPDGDDPEVPTEVMELFDTYKAEGYSVAEALENAMVEAQEMGQQAGDEAQENEAQENEAQEERVEPVPYTIYREIVSLVALAHHAAATGDAAHAAKILEDALTIDRRYSAGR